MKLIEADGQDVEAVYLAALAAREHALSGKGPVLLHLRTHRLTGHFVGDPQVYRDKDELKEERETKDPIRLLGAAARASATTSSRRSTPRSRPRSRRPSSSRRRAPTRRPRTRSSTSMPELTYREAVRDALGKALREDESVFIMGEDIAEMGGSMAVTQGLLDEFGPGRVRNTPISEMAIVGSGIGAAIQGMRPIVEIMYEDFLTLSMEQLVNQAAKHRTMSGGQVKVPLTIRTQGGAGWSPGAQHAQQLEAWFVHVPGLKVVFASTPEDVRGLLWSSIYDDNPVVFFEHRTLYPIKGEVPEELEPIPLGKARIHREGEDVTVVATGRLVHEALQAAEEAEKEGISVEVVDPRTLLPLDEETIVASVRKTTRCVTAHEAVTRGGFGAELAAVIQHGAFDYLDAPIERVGAKFAPLAVRAGDGAVGRPARGRRPRGDPADGRAGRSDVAVEVKLPRLGQGMESGTIVRWLKSEGDAVAKGEPLYELDTDKVTQEVEAESDGVLLKIVVADGEVDVGTTVGIIGAEDEDVVRAPRRAQGGNGDAPAAPTRGGGEPRRAAPTQAEQQPDAASRTRSQATRALRRGGRRCAAARRGERVKASPLARRIARERGIDLAQIDRHRARGPRHRRGRREGGSRGRAAPSAPAASAGEVEVVELTSTRKTIARRLTEAWQAPVFQLTVTADATELVATRERMVELCARARRSRRSPTCSRASSRRRSCATGPVNAHFVDGKIQRFPAANVGIAVAAPSGLVVPVIRDADRKSVQQIAADRADLVSRARDGKLQLAGPRGRDVHDLEPRDVRDRAVHRRAQPAAGRDPRGRLDRGPPGGDRRRARDRPDDDDDADVRPPRDRRLRGRRVPARRQGASSSRRRSRL